MDDEQRLTAEAVLRRARPGDEAGILECIGALATYEREPEAVETTADTLRQSLFCPSPSVFAHVIARHERIIGIAVWFLNYSTWTGRGGIYLEDLFVYPDERGRGYGKALLRTLAQLCAERGSRSLGGPAPAWNHPAIGFYRSIGAVGMDEWTVQRLSGDALTRLADG